MSARERTVLLVGYGWFAGIPQGETNNTELIARALDGAVIESEGIRGRVHALVVPVTWAGAFPPVEAAIDALHPDIVLALGTDARAGAMRPEPYGVNWQRGRDADPDDPARETVMDGPVTVGGPDALRGTLPYEAMVRAMLQAGIPARLGALTDAGEGAPLPVGCTAGMYLCNTMAYRLAELSARTGLRAGFMHVPTQPGYAAARRLREMAAADDAERTRLMREPVPSSMPLEQMIEGTRAAIIACLKES